MSRGKLMKKPVTTRYSKPLAQLAEKVSWETGLPMSFDAIVYDDDPANPFPAVMYRLPWGRVVYSKKLPPQARAATLVYKDPYNSEIKTVLIGNRDALERFDLYNQKAVVAHEGVHDCQLRGEIVDFAKNDPKLYNFLQKMNDYEQWMIHNEEDIRYLLEGEAATLTKAMYPGCLEHYPREQKWYEEQMRRAGVNTDDLVQAYLKQSNLRGDVPIIGEGNNRSGIYNYKLEGPVKHAENAEIPIRIIRKKRVPLRTPKTPWEILDRLLEGF